jgi:2,3,4,5-tetrahydropyridine-2,6-dicarboxylate N-succinyltransferase
MRIALVAPLAECLEAAEPHINNSPNNCNQREQHMSHPLQATIDDLLGKPHRADHPIHRRRQDHRIRDRRSRQRQTARRREDQRRVGGQPVGQEGRAAVLPHSRQPCPGSRRPSAFYDKVDTKFAGLDRGKFKAGGFRVVPGAFARKGSFIAKNAVLMPSFVNIGAYVDEGTMVDTWATVGSCAQIGKNVHLSGGVGIGGVLEPIQANPTSSKTTASSAPVRKSSKASSSAKAR